MYHSSSQKRHWTFASEEQLARLRADANRKFKCKAVANGKVRSPQASPSCRGNPRAFLLSPCARGRPGSRWGVRLSPPRDN